MFKHCNIPRDVVRILGTVSVVGLIGALGLIALGHPVPNELWMIVTTTAGSLGAMLSQTRTHQNEPTNVNVVNPSDDPVNVVDTGEPTL